MSRTVCIVIVEAPDTLLAPVTFCQSALRTLPGLTPRCVQKLPSSEATMALTIQSSGEARYAGRQSASSSPSVTRRILPEASRRTAPAG